MLVNAGISSPPFVGGFSAELPKGFALPNWTYKIVFDHSDPTLTSFKTLNRLCIQIDCFGNADADALALAQSIDGVLDGFSGRLPDPDSTWVNTCFNTDRQNFFEDSPRNYRRMLEFTLMYAKS